MGAKLIHEYRRMSREARTWGVIASEKEISHAQMQEYLKGLTNSDKLILGTLLRIADATEKHARAMEKLNRLLHCPNCVAIPAKLNAIAKNTEARRP